MSKPGSTIVFIIDIRRDSKYFFRNLFGQMVHEKVMTFIPKYIIYLIDSIQKNILKSISVLKYLP